MGPSRSAFGRGDSKLEPGAHHARCERGKGASDDIIVFEQAQRDKHLRSSQPFERWALRGLTIASGTIPNAAHHVLPNDKGDDEHATDDEAGNHTGCRPWINGAAPTEGQHEDDAANHEQHHTKPIESSQFLPKGFTALWFNVIVLERSTGGGGDGMMRA